MNDEFSVLSHEDLGVWGVVLLSTRGAVRTWAGHSLRSPWELGVGLSSLSPEWKGRAESGVLLLHRTCPLGASLSVSETLQRGLHVLHTRHESCSGARSATPSPCSFCLEQSSFPRECNFEVSPFYHSFLFFFLMI